ncbi:alpha-1,3-rhamnosyltransferase [Acinetobacter bereziniae]|uniref:glycosyltransferase family 2 protein n=1 Tax=Acinetobacter bereziniae TaxID=106648 RepID=UPI0028658AF8|nr:glycosyltransferase [Acinetobacter bereziniae]MDR6543216.1 alpha-1,3-rhamnosyltransferase [Acinetobacter bereziniae]
MSLGSQPLVSVVIPCYNHENFVKDCIQSVIDQTYENIELIIIDDGSEDDSVVKIQELVSKCVDRFTRFEFRYRSNKGLSATLNEALIWCNGKYFSSIASDDILFTNKIKFQVEYLENQINVAGVFGDVKVLQNNIDNTVVKKNKKTIIKRFNFDDVINHRFTLWAPTQMLKLDIIRDIGGFKDGIVIEDWYLWLKITQCGFDLDYINQSFAYYRRHENNMSSNYEKMYKGRLDILNYFPDYLDLSEPKANICLVTANDYLSLNRMKSLNYFFEAVRANPKLFFKFYFNLKVIKYLLKFIMV